MWRQRNVTNPGDVLLDADKITRLHSTLAEKCDKKRNHKMLPVCIVSYIYLGYECVASTQNNIWQNEIESHVVTRTFQRNTVCLMREEKRNCINRCCCFLLLPYVSGVSLTLILIFDLWLLFLSFLIFVSPLTIPTPRCLSFPSVDCQSIEISFYTPLPLQSKSSSF